MIDIDEIMKRAQAASEQAAETMKKTFEKSEEIARSMKSPISEPEEEPISAPDEEEQMNANTQRQVEILGQIFGADSMAQMAANEELLQTMVNEKVAEATANGVNSLMGQLFGEDMGVIAAALETMAMEDDDETEDLPFDLEMEQNLYAVLDAAMLRTATLPEPEAIPYQTDRAKWERFGILLSGIISNLNSHDLDKMDVEEHIPVLEQRVVSLVRRSWGIDGRGELLDTIRYLSQEGYILRYQLYAEAVSPEELMDKDMNEEECESVCRAWRFVEHYKNQFSPRFLAGWDIGRAAMLARWGCYLGWITEGEAVGILWELSQKAAEDLHSWREFAQSYLFGGLMWKLLCGDSAAESYLGYIADAATNLLTGKSNQDGGQWREHPWPAQRKIGFTL